MKTNAANSPSDVTGIAAVDAADAKGEVAGHESSGDVKLMRRLRDGEEAAMCQLVEEHGEMLSRLVGRLTGWHHDRDDILQDVLMAVWQKAGRFRGTGSLDNWLRSIAINRCRNYFRATSSVKRMIERLVSFGVVETVRQPDAIELDDEIQRLQVALQRLPQADRTVLVLFYMEELSGEEISRMLKVKQETLHVRLHRARQKLKLVIGREHDEDI